MFNKVSVVIVFPMNFNQFNLYKGKVILWNLPATLILDVTLINNFMQCPNLVPTIHIHH